MAGYVTLYLFLIVAYIGALKYMAEKPLEHGPATPSRLTQSRSFA